MARVIIQQASALFILLIGLLISGCANLQHEQTLKELKSQISELEKRQAKTNAGLEELNNKFLLFQEQADINKKEIKELKAMAVPVIPPDELKVVQLEAEEINGETNKESLKIEEAKKTESLPSPEALYNEAQNLFMAGRLAEAAEQFAKFIAQHPKHSLADNAQYWIGEVYYSEKDYQKAAVEFKKVFDNYPNENKAPDALLKAGFSYLELNNKDKALEFLK
ncbi:MAG: tol-pal system protein YbgF, partial [Deltaproteobacteria bacterium]|nr:tol-pal system protein YbgF [Deltaproteobacteria bacterium]